MVAAWIPLALTGILLGFMVLPRIHGNPSLVLAFVIVGSLLLVWQAAVWRQAAQRHQTLRVEFKAYPSHYIQAFVQASVLLYWGWYVSEVYAQISLILAQLVFLYIIDALLSWTRGTTWRVGFGPLPVILSMNLFIWFRDDWFMLQFMAVAVAALGKNFPDMGT